jgi:DNA-binding beta-propeller fold protein YncE
MPTVAELYRDIGDEINDPSNARVEHWRLLGWINKAVAKACRDTNCLWATTSLTGQRMLTVVDYSVLAMEAISITVSGVAYPIIIAAAASNSAMATAIAVQLDAITGVASYADGANVYVLGIDDYEIDSITTSDSTNLTIADAGYEKFKLLSILTRFRRMGNIVDPTNGLIYDSVTRQRYDTALVDSGFAGYLYYVSPSSELYLKVAGANASSGVSFSVGYFQYPATLVASDSLPALLNDHEECVIAYVKYLYHIRMGEYDKAKFEIGRYQEMTANLRREIRSQGEPQTQNQFLQMY